MNIAWFTPFNQHSSIGHVSQLLIDQLCQQHEVDVWLSQHDNLLTTAANKIFYTLDSGEIDHKRCQSLMTYDMILYHMGDNFDYHAKIYEVSKLYPGIIILHDYVMHHFFVEYFFRQNKQDDYLKLIHSTYGEAAMQETAASINPDTKPIWEMDHKMLEYPLYEPILAHSKGVITHSQWVTRKIHQVYAGPVLELPLPSAAEQKIKTINFTKTTSTQDSIKIEPSTSRRIQLLTIGNVNPNKCIDAVITLLGKNSSLKNKVKYNIVGEYNPKQPYFQHLQQLIATYSLEDTVHFYGYQPDEHLINFLMDADICLTLRWPAMESASGSVIEQMYFGKAIIVYNTGFYAELPYHTVTKVEPLQEADLLAALCRLIDDREASNTQGLDAQQYISQRHTAHHYLTAMLQFCHQLKANEPIMQLIQTVGAELNNMNVHTFMPTLSRVVNEINAMINPTSNAIEGENLNV